MHFLLSNNSKCLSIDVTRQILMMGEEKKKKKKQTKEMKSHLRSSAALSRHAPTIAPSMARQSFLSDIGMRFFGPSFLDFGVRNLAELCDPTLISDSELASVIGMSAAQISTFRAAVAQANSRLDKAALAFLERFAERRKDGGKQRAAALLRVLCRGGGGSGCVLV